MFDLHACLHTVGCLDPVGAKKENRTHMKLELQLWSAMGVLGTESRFDSEAPSIINWTFI